MILRRRIDIWSIFVTLDFTCFSRVFPFRGFPKDDFTLERFLVGSPASGLFEI